MQEQPAGSSPEQPLYMAMIRTEAGEIRWGRIAVMLALTVASGFLAAYAQRAGSDPDFLRQARMRALRAAERTAHAGTVACQRIEGFARTAYEIERL